MSTRFVVEGSTYPDLPEMMLATLRALRRLGGSATLHELDEAVVEGEGVSEAEQQIMMPNGTQPKLNYYLAWSRTFLRRGDALINSARGVWALTDRGESIDSIEPVRSIFDTIQVEEKERARLRRAGPEDTPPSPEKEEAETPDGNLEDWKQSLLSVLLKMDPAAFERLTQRLLREAGFTKVEVRGKVGDGGIDGIGVLRVNLVSFQIYFQCKRWRGSVGSREIRDFRGALQGRADKGLFVTTGVFTSQASEEATRDGAIAIDLIDGDRLCDLLKEHSLGLSTELVERVTVDADWYQSI